MARSTATLTLGPWAAQSCPVKTQNAHDPRIGRFSAAAPDESLRELFAGTEQWRSDISDRLAALPGAVDLRTDPGRVAERVQRCRQAMAAGAPLLLGAQLPADVRGHRHGRCDVLIRADEAGRPTYHPVLVKGHRVREPRTVVADASGLRVSGLDDPAWSAAAELPGSKFRPRREADVLQLAHFHRMLQACGFEADGSPLGGVIGTDDPVGVTWLRLDEPRFRTFSRRTSGGWRLRSGLERHDHEHGFRVSVAERASRLGEPGVAPMVQPIRVEECNRCQWWEHCRPQLHAEDLSLRIAKAPLDVREISVLRSLGVRTTAELATADLDQLLPRYLPEVAHRPQAERRLRTTARRARLISEGVTLDRLEPGPVPVPGAEIEIDFDIETSAGDRVYLWGFLVNDTVAGTSEFRSFVAWDDLDDATELDLARQALGWLQSVVVQGGRGVRVYHYSDYETQRIARLTERADHEGSVLRWARDETEGVFVDLFEIVRDHLFGVHGLGLKVVASTGAGFAWRDEDPGGLNSQRWFAEAVHGADETERQTARTRVLEYNEDDVAATAALRRWLRSLS